MIRWLMGRPLRVFLGRHDLAIAHVHDAVAIRGGFGIVRNHQHGLPQILVRLAQHVENDVRAFRSQVAGGLVGEHDRGAVDKSAGQRDSLLLAAGEFVRPVLQPFGDAQHPGDLLQERGIGRSQAGNVAGNLDVRARAECGQKIKFLENETDLAFAQSRALAIGKCGKIHAIDGDASRVGAGQSAQ